MLRDVGMSGLLDFECGWRPPLGGFARYPRCWRDWPAFFQDYELVRDEFLDRRAARVAENIARGERPSREMPFAERALAAWIECGRQASPAFEQRLRRADVATEKAFVERDEWEAKEDLKATEREDDDGWEARQG